MERQGRKIKRITMVNVDSVSVMAVGDRGVEKIEPSWINTSPDSEVGVYRAYDKRGLLIREVHASIPMDIEYGDGDESHSDIIKSYLGSRLMTNMGDIDKSKKIKAKDLHSRYANYCSKYGYVICTLDEFIAEMKKEKYVVTMIDGVDCFITYNIF